MRCPAHCAWEAWLARAARVQPLRWACPTLVRAACPCAAALQGTLLLPFDASGFRDGLPDDLEDQMSGASE